MMEMIKNDIRKLFMPGCVVSYDLLYEFAVLSYADQEHDGLFFIRDDGRERSPLDLKKSTGKVREMIIAVAQHERRI